MKAIFDDVSFEMSKLVTKQYSTSFSLGIRFLDPAIRRPIYAIYGFVRLADEIVDSFDNYNKKELLESFKNDTYRALHDGISLNPILNSFQLTVNKYKIDHELIALFLKSMEMDLYRATYNSEGYNDYIVGSAEVVGLMCLRVYCFRDDLAYNSLKGFARRLGAAYQKINFLRDLSSDYKTLGRVYFPGVNILEFNEKVKSDIVKDIEKDFKVGYEGILRLPKNSRFGVYLSYIYFYTLFQKIKIIPPQIILQHRVRLMNRYKYFLFFRSYVQDKFHMIQWQN